MYGSKVVKKRGVVLISQLVVRSFTFRKPEGRLFFFSILSSDSVILCFHDAEKARSWIFFWLGVWRYHRIIEFIE